MSDATMLPAQGTPKRVRAQRKAGFAQSVVFSAARGAALIGVAVVIGIVLLQVVDDGTSGPIGDSGGSGKGKGAAITTTTQAARSSSTSATSGGSGGARSPGQVKVQVLNGSGTAGAAGALTTKLQGDGYQTLDKNDTAARQGTVVYCIGGYEREGAALAAAVGANPPARTDALPDPPPDNADTTANCIVVLGS